MPYQQVIHLVEAWSEFAKRTNEPTLEGFGHWLAANARQNTIPGTSFDSLNRSMDPPGGLDARDSGKFINRYSTLNQASILVGRLSRLTKLYYKKVFADRTELSIEEVMMLISALNLGPVRKTDLINHNLVEITTGTEMLRRLLRLGCLVETPNPNDARSKILNITEKGKELVYSSYPNLNMLSMLLFSPLSEPEVVQIRDLMSKVNDFHSQIYLNHRDEPLDEYSRHFPIPYPDHLS